MPSLASSEFDKFWQMGMVFHAVTITGAEHLAHIFGVSGFQGAEKDPEKLALTESLFQDVFW